VVRFAHLSPDTPAVDVALAPLPPDGGHPLTDPGPDVATDLRYGDVSAYAPVSPGRYAVSIRAAGTPRSTPPRLTERIDVPAGAARTVALSGLFADLALRSLPDDLTAPSDGRARVRVLSASSARPSVDVGLDGAPALATRLRFGEAGDRVDVPAGPASVRIAGAAAVPIDLRPGSVDTLLVLDAPDGGLTVRVVQDAAGPAITPVGAVEAGGGGTAGSRTPLPVAAGAVAAAENAPVPRPAATDGPLRLSVPSIGIDTALTGIDLDAAGALVPPSDDSLAGWYRSGPEPGETGPAVITGHVDSTTGPAVFFRLRQLAAGDAVVVTRADGSTLRFTVARVERYPKTAFPAAEVYAPTPMPELRLITCGGAFDRAARSYLDDVVVYAVLG
jgi:Domain of unknown function (DUF4397)/Sortase domain